MAIHKTKNTEYGVNANYWNIGAIQEDIRNGGVEVTLYGYTDKAASNAKMQPLSAAKITVVGADYTPEMKRPELYAYIKRMPEFADGTDV